MSEQEELVLEAGSPDEARGTAAHQMGLAAGDVRIEQIGETKRLFGLLGRKITYRATPAAPRHMLEARDLLRGIALRMGAEIEVTLGGEDVLDVRGEGRDTLLGSYGEPLRALEYLLNLMMRERLGGIWLRLDSDGYREHREQNLQRLALSAAEEAGRRRRPISLDPMTSWERRIIHLALREREDVETRSVGEDPMRRVVVWPRKAQVRSVFRPRRAR